MVIDVQVSIDGTVVGDVESSSIRNSVGANNSASSFNLLIDNKDGVHNTDISVGDEVVIKADKDTNPPTTNIFTGIVEDLSYSSRESVGEKITVTGRDYAARLQDVTVEPTVFDNTETSEIVTAIMAQAITDVTTNNVNVTSVIITSIQFNHTPVFDALKQLANLSGHIFYVDENKDLHFELKSAVSSGLTFDSTNTTVANFRTVERELYNRIWIYGDRVLTKWQNSFTANGGSVYNLESKPHNTQVLVGGSTAPKAGGVFQLVIDPSSVGSPTQYLVDFNNRDIIFVSGTATGDNIPVSGTDGIVVNYDRATPIIKFGEDPASIATFGPKTLVINDKNIITASAASDRLSAELEEHASPRKQGTVTVNGVLTLQAGNTVTADFSNQNINSEVFDVLEVRYNFDTVSRLSENVMTVRLNKRIIDLTDTIKKLMLDVRALQGADNLSTDVISRLISFTGSFGLGGSFVIQTRAVRDSFVIGRSLLGSEHPYSGLSQLQRGTSGANMLISESGVQFSGDPNSSWTSPKINYSFGSIADSRENTYNTLTWSGVEGANDVLHAHIFLNRTNEYVTGSLPLGSSPFVISGLGSLADEPIDVRFQASGEPILFNWDLDFVPTPLGDRRDAPVVQASGNF